MHAYITLLSTMNYLPGVIGLARSLGQTKPDRPLYVALSANVPADVDAKLKAKGMHPLRLPDKSPLERVPDQKQHHWTHTFDKLHLFGLTQFDKLVYLDSDMMILANIDELFDKPH
ncbi:MAG TPA: glycosyltransferase, partial [Hymenobacter sp.]